MSSCFANFFSANQPIAREPWMASLNKSAIGLDPSMKVKLIQCEILRGPRPHGLVTR